MGNPGAEDDGGHDPGGIPAPAAGLLFMWGPSRTGDGSAAPPAPQTSPADGDVPFGGAAGCVALYLLQPVPGRSAAGVLSGDAGGLLPLGMGLRGSNSGLFRPFVAFRWNPPGGNPEIFSKKRKFPLLKMEKMEYNR